MLAALVSLVLSMTACNDFLDREPDKIMTDEQIFSDPVMIKFGELLWSCDMGTTCCRLGIIYDNR